MLLYAVTPLPPSTSEVTVTQGLSFRVANCTQIVSASCLQRALQVSKMGLKCVCDAPAYAAGFLVIYRRNIYTCFSPGVLMEFIQNT